MVCNQCAAAADARAPRDQHCNVDDPSSACDCAHRTDRYRTAESDRTIDLSGEH